MVRRPLFFGIVRGASPSIKRFVLYVPFCGQLFFVALKRENPVITDWVRGSGGSTEGTLGR